MVKKRHPNGNAHKNTMFTYELERQGANPPMERKQEGGWMDCESPGSHHKGSPTKNAAGEAPTLGSSRLSSPRTAYPQ